MGLIDHLGALIVPNLANVFGIFMLTQFFRTLPIELEEAARIDGASRLKILFLIVLPLSAPALATLAVIQFMWTWNDFLWPLVTIYNEPAYTLQLGLQAFQGAHLTEWNLLMAGNVMSMIPMLVLFLAGAAVVRPRHRDPGPEGLMPWPRSTFEHVSKVFPPNKGEAGVIAVDDLSLEVGDGEFLILVGPSGCGKSTALRMVAGLEKISAGEIRVGRRARSTTCRRRSATSRWCSRTTRSTRT